MHLSVSHAGHGTRVALVHGFTQTSTSWRLVAEDLVRDHEVISVDAPGHGRSADVRADLALGGDLLVGVAGRATYIGYSMGARFCLRAALDHPDMVERLVLIGVTAGLEDPQQRQARCEADEELARTIETDGVDAFLDQWLARPMFADVPDDRADRRLNTPAGLASSLRLAGTGAQATVWDRLSGLTMPVLVLAGERDEKFAELGQRVATSIGDNAQFALVPGAGHAAHLEQPQAFIALVRRWLALQPAS
jgi:2-succinyl-6-hydroxy-2,4-cyclohexadiene-1-carboxylate synthase